MLNIDDKNITQSVLSKISIPTDDRMCGGEIISALIGVGFK
ncbi:hypothetical protein SAMN03159353_103925 [Cedecea sp. NFIX57]|nr:hypothetical protein SAMN03159353_103925 [Cedecea sp. NFIX57]